MVTDGVLECGERRYETPVNLYSDMNRNNIKLEESVHHVLEHVHHQFGRDSATIISWDIDNKGKATYPSDQPEKIKSKKIKGEGFLSITKITLLILWVLCIFVFEKIARKD